MKAILSPTDFSKIALNAINYAAEIAVRSKTKLVLFHVFHTPLLVSEVPVVIPTLDEMEKESLKQLKKIEDKLKVKYGTKLKTECVAKCGLAVDEIKQYVKENTVELVVMGMHGAGYLEEKFFGSITTSLIHDANFPVLIINKKVKYKSIKKIMLACDYLEIKDKTILNPLKQLAELYKSHIYILNVLNKQDKRPTITEAVASIKLENAIEGLKHSFHYVKNEDIITGINDFTSTNQMDMIVMIPRKHSIFKRMVNEPNTKRMAFHAEIPLLALHE